MLLNWLVPWLHLSAVVLYANCSLACEHKSV